jgi:hypothetical protein
MGSGFITAEEVLKDQKITRLRLAQLVCPRQLTPCPLIPSSSVAQMLGLEKVI